MHELWKYIVLQLDVVPKTIYLGLLALFCVGTIVLLAVNRKKAGRHIAWLLFFEYVFFCAWHDRVFQTHGHQGKGLPSVLELCECLPGWRQDSAA